MSVYRNRAKTKLAIDNQEYRKLLLNEWYPRYWDDGIKEYPNFKRGFKNPNKFIFHYQYRMFRTWKHNRKTQWKE